MLFTSTQVHCTQKTVLYPRTHFKLYC